MVTWLRHAAWPASSWCSSCWWSSSCWSRSPRSRSTQSTREFREVRGQRMIAVAENMASTPIVRDRYADPFAAQVLAPEVDRAVALSGAGLAEILDPDGTVRVSSDPSRIGATDGPRRQPGRRGPGLVRRRRHRRRAQPRRPGADPVRSTATCWPSPRSASRTRRCGNCSAARASGCWSTSGSAPRSACWRRGCCRGGSSGTPAAWRSPRSPAWPITGKRCCTASVRAWSR